MAKVLLLPHCKNVNSQVYRWSSSLKLDLMNSLITYIRDRSVLYCMSCRVEAEEIKKGSSKV